MTMGYATWEVNKKVMKSIFFHERLSHFTNEMAKN
jgi:hypothetical protein